MEQITLNFTASGQRLTINGGMFCASHTVNWIEAVFTLGENWDSFDSVSAIWFNDYCQIATVLDSLGRCTVPLEVLKRKGIVRVNLVGSVADGDTITDRLTTYPLEAIRVDAIARTSGTETQPITPSQFEQFAQAVKSDADRAETAASDSEASAVRAERARDEAIDSAGESAGYADDASDSARQASASADSASEYAGQAQDARDDILNMTAEATTLPAGSDATASYSDGVMSFGIPKGDKGDKGDKGNKGDTGATGATGNGIASIAKTGTSGLVDTYTITFTSGNTTSFEVTNGNGIASVTLTDTSGLTKTYTITFTDGSTTTFMVQDGEVTEASLISVLTQYALDTGKYFTDTEPYTFRTAPSGDYNRESDTVVGGTVAWNQLFCPRDDSTFTIGGVPVTVSGGKFTMNGTATSNGGRITGWNKSGYNFPILQNHVYYSDTPIVLIANKISDNTNFLYFGEGKHVSKYTGTSVEAAYIGVNVIKETNYTNSGYVQIVDLTAMFGSQIADYIYTLEQGTAGAGVAFFKRLFPKSYYPYDSGSLQSVSGVSAHKTVGFNQWDEQWESGTIDNTTGAKVASVT